MSAVDLLRNKFNPPAFIVLEEVRNSTGFGHVVRTADALVVSTWPSRGLWIHGFEVKSTRADWMRELNEPTKADEIMRFCNHWSLLTTADGIANADEIPVTWGWVQVGKRGLHTAKAAPDLKPEPLTMDFVASLVRRFVTGMIHKSEIEGEIEEAKEQERRSNERVITGLKLGLENKQKDLDRWRELTGLDPERGWGREYNDGPAAVKLVLESGVSMEKLKSCVNGARTEFRVDHILTELELMVEQCRRIKEEIWGSQEHKLRS